MASKAQIVNLALSRIGVTKQVANVETERTKEALAANLVFDDERDYVLRDFPWPFARAITELGLVDGEAGDPVNYDWIYAYRYPSDALYIRRIVSPLGRNDTTRRPYAIGRDEQGKLIYTDEEDAQVEYTVRISDPEEFDPLFVSAFAWRLGAVFAPSMSRIKGMAEKCLEMYELDRAKAQSRALNEQDHDENPDAESIQARA